MIRCVKTLCKNLSVNTDFMSINLRIKKKQHQYAKNCAIYKCAQSASNAYFESAKICLRTSGLRFDTQLIGTSLAQCHEDRES